MARYRPPPPKRSKYITPEGAARLRREHDHLWRTQRPAVTRAVAEAAAQGDRSENAEYIYGKKQLAAIDRRLRYLRKRLDELRIVAQAPEDTSRVRFGANFTLSDESGARLCYRLVGPDEIDFASGNVSMDSPLGKAVLGKRVGDEVRLQAPAGTHRYEVREIAYRIGEEDKRSPAKPG